MARDSRSVGERRKDILHAAEELISRQGYKETSLDAIVEQAGCSKTMIYSYFGDKQGLLAALSEDIVRELSAALSDSTGDHAGIDHALLGFARRTLELVLSARHIAVVQVIISEFRSAPGVGQDYFDLGPKAAQRQLSEYLEEAARQGILRIADVDYAARQFFALVLWDHMYARLVGASEELTAEQVESEARRAVASFLRLYPPMIEKMPARQNRTAKHQSAVSNTLAFRAPGSAGTIE
jgi:TetR/AcrR family transcriptional repressor of mexJK operon